MTTLSAISEHDQRRRDALGERLFDASRAALDVYCVHIGDRLGLYAAPMARVAVALGRPLPELLEAFRSGGGVPWTAYCDDGREAQVDMNRVEFIHRLGSEWLPSIAGAVLVMDERPTTG